MYFQAESLLAVFSGCTLLGGAGLFLALLGGLLPRPAPAKLSFGLGSAESGVAVSGGRKSLWRCLCSLVSFGLFFGLGGLLASWMGVLPALQVVAALLSGLLVGGVTAWAIQLAGQPRPPGLADGSLVGRTGRVLLSPQGRAPGQVLLGAGSLETGQRQHLPARSSDRLMPGDRVLVVADAGGLLDVLRWEGEGQP